MVILMVLPVVSASSFSFAFLPSLALAVTAAVTAAVAVVVTAVVASAEFLGAAKELLVKEEVLGV